MDCIFCKIAEKTAEAKIVLEDDFYMAFWSIKPQAPVDLIVIPRVHISKKESMSGFSPMLWDQMMKFTADAIRTMGLDKTGYRIVNNGAGYNQIDHEHVHILGGANWRPKDDL